MTAAQWARVKEVFHAALEQDASRRAAFVEAATAGDELVRAEVDRLLAADLHSAGFIERPAAATLESGRVLSHYEIGHLLGSGGMGRVYAARDTELGREVALKVATLDSPDAQARLRREAQHASRLSHPNICHIYDVGRADGQLFVVMERVDGRSLAEVLGEGPLPIETAQRYGAEIADALAHAHERGVTHRDLKSTNVMITPRGAKVLDFGLARMLDTHQIDALSHSQRSLTGEGMIAGTLSYMAPELLRGERGDQRADIWALGVLLYEMVGGRRPFTGGTGFELSAAILHQAPEALPAAVPAPMTAIVQRCLAKAPGDRYQQAADVHLALREMKEPPRHTQLRLPAVSTRLVAGALLLVVVAAVAAALMYRIGEAGSAAFSNARGYSLLQTGELERAIAEFEGLTERDQGDANSWDSLGEGYLAGGKADKSLEAYSRALTIEPTFESSQFGRTLALAALGQYDEAVRNASPDFRIRAFLLSRVGRYAQAQMVLEAGRSALAARDPEAAASALLTSSWLSIERRQYARALDEIRTAETALRQDADEPDHSLLVFADLLGGVAEIGAGNVAEAVTRLAAQKARYDRDDRVEANWVAALEGEVALAQGQLDRAAASFAAAASPAWITLGRDTLIVFLTNPPSRDGTARVELARGNRAAAIEHYRRLTAVGPGVTLPGVLEPLHVLALARLLEAAGDLPGARGEYARFLKLWATGDQELPEMEEARRAVARLPAS
jgi:tetratricopeptide (TPR) repeat protein/predicted Ser/Thr protein kinase